MDELYTKALYEGRDLVAACQRGEFLPVEFREDEVSKALELLDRKRSVLVVGPSGVGKTAVVHGIAGAFGDRGRSGLRQLSTAQILAGTRYIGEWQTKLNAIAERAEVEDVVVYWSDIWNMSSAGRTVQSTMTMLDALRPRIEAGELRVVGEVTPELQRLMSRVPGFSSMFETVEVSPLSEAHIATILEHASERLRLSLDPDTRRALVTLTDRFLAVRPQPGPALNLPGASARLPRPEEGGRRGRGALMLPLA